MMWLKWALKIAIQLVPILIHMDWGRPKPTDYHIPHYEPKPKRRKRKWNKLID